MFKVNNKDTRATSMTSCWCLYCWIYFAHCSSVSIVDFEQVNVAWVIFLKKVFTYRKTSETFEVKTVAKQIKNTRVKLITQQVQSFWLSGFFLDFISKTKTWIHERQISQTFLQSLRKRFLKKSMRSNRHYFSPKYIKEDLF